jgi:hypothetical protein
LFKVCKGGHLALDSFFSSDTYEYSAVVSSSTAELYYLKVKNAHRLYLDYGRFREILYSLSCKIRESRAIKIKANNKVFQTEYFDIKKQNEEKDQVGVKRQKLFKNLL